MTPQKKEERLNIQHEKEASVYDKARAWSDLEPITAESVKDIPLDPKTTLMLDVACGTGRVATYFKDKVETVIGADISVDMLKVAQEESRIDLGVIASGEELPFLDTTFDLLYSRSALHYMDVEKALREWVRVTKNDGWVINSDVSYEREELNDWYRPVLKAIFEDWDLVPHQKIIKSFQAMEQEDIDVTVHMIQGSLNDILERKHVSTERTQAVRKLFSDTPEYIKKELRIENKNGDYLFDFGLAVVRCHVKK